MAMLTHHFLQQVYSFEPRKHDFFRRSDAFFSNIEKVDETFVYKMIDCIRNEIISFSCLSKSYMSNCSVYLLAICFCAGLKRTFASLSRTFVGTNLA